MALKSNMMVGLPIELPAALVVAVFAVPGGPNEREEIGGDYTRRYKGRNCIVVCIRPTFVRNVKEANARYRTYDRCHHEWP